MKQCMAFLVAILCAGAVRAAEDVDGLWTTVDDESGEPKSVVQVYNYDGKIYGRVVKLFKNVDKTAVGIEGDPKIVGLDIIWNLEDRGERFKGGQVLDPAKGKIYTAEMWREGDKLILRGKIGPFGRNQTWLKNSSDVDLLQKNLQPHIPQKK